MTDARIRLESLEKDLWYMRYGDYFARNVATLRRGATGVNDAAKKTVKAAGSAPFLNHLLVEAAHTYQDLPIWVYLLGRQCD